MTADPAARNATCHIDIAGDGSISGLTDDLDGQINQRNLSVCSLTDVLLQIPLTDRLFVSGSCHGCVDSRKTEAHSQPQQTYRK
jgi:hypothetical protein